MRKSVAVMCKGVPEMKMTKTALIVLMAMILLLGFTVPASAAKRVTIADIHEETKDGWHETYEAHGRTITVDVDIEVPDVLAVPIIRIGYPSFPESLETSDPDVMVFLEDIGIDKESRAGYIKGDGDHFEITGEDARAENNPLSFDEAREIIEAFFSKYQTYTGPLDLRLYAHLAYSRFYVRESRNGDISDLNLDKPTSEVGAYSFVYHQYFHGIPDTRSFPFDVAVQSKTHMNYAGGISYGDVASANDYNAWFTPGIEKEVIIEDIPLAPFSQVKKEFEKQIKAGLLREVCSVRLVYFCYMDKENPGETFILQPVWELRGNIVEKPSYQNQPPHEFSPEHSRKYYGQYAVIDAYSGEALGNKANWEYADLSVYSQK